MAHPLTQSGVAAACALSAYCSGASLNTDKKSTQAEYAGSAGGSAVQVTIDANAANLLAVWMEGIIGSTISWDAGTWTVRLNVTTSSSFITWESVYICRLSSACANQATIASVTALGISLGTTGVKTATVPGGVLQGPAAGDKIMVILGFTNSNSQDRSFWYTPNQNIDAPFTKLYGRLLGLHSEPIPKHQFAAMIAERARGKITLSQMQQDFGIIAGEQEATDLDVLLARFSDGSPLTYAEFDDVMMGVDNAFPGYQTVTELKARIGV